MQNKVWVFVRVNVAYEGRADIETPMLMREESVL
jgi:hypothetical protein